jgi:hypothetical protein
MLVIWQKNNSNLCTELKWLRIGPKGGFCEHDNEASGSANAGNLLPN